MDLTRPVHEQIIAFIGIVESFSYEKCFYGQPGDGNLGFDPLQMGKNPATLAYYKVTPHPNLLQARKATLQLPPDLQHTHTRPLLECC